MRFLGLHISFDNSGDALNVAWKGYLALFVAMGITFIAIVLMNKFLKDKKSE
jgi:hypothetical protein